MSCEACSATRLELIGGCNCCLLQSHLTRLQVVHHSLHLIANAVRRHLYLLAVLGSVSPGVSMLSLLHNVYAMQYIYVPDSDGFG